MFLFSLQMLLLENNKEHPANYPWALIENLCKKNNDTRYG